MDFSDVLSFWFDETDPELWFSKDKEFDDEILERFLALHGRARSGELWTWRKSAEGRLAEIIVLDQLSRNMFRDRPESFASDPLALILAQEGVAVGADLELETEEKSFFYMPYMHSESPLIHEQAVHLFSKPGLEYNLDFEYRHKKIIDQFGRFPHRNRILGRVSTPQEIEFLKQPGSSF
jgi:uncharacterized protein (DUF924 family)